MSPQPHRDRPRQLGFTVIEMLATIGMIGTFTFLVIATISPLFDKAESAKLKDQVGALNQAVQVYLSSGGTLTSSSTASQVIAKLRSTADEHSAKQIAGFRGSFIDPRLQPIWQTPDQARSSEPRALWHPLEQRFIIATESAETGIASFDLSEDPQAITEETRMATMKLATESGWIWDFQDTAMQRPFAPSQPTTSVETSPPVNQVKDAVPHLKAPLFSPPSGTYSILDYPLAVSLLDPNPAGASTLIYSIDGGPWIDYDSTPIPTAPDTQLVARAMTEHPSLYRSSPPNVALYTADPHSLTPPTIDLSASQFHHEDQPEITVTLEHTNNPAVSAIFYRLRPQEVWQPYETPFTLSSLDYGETLTLTAYVGATADHYLDSDTVSDAILPASPLQLMPPVISLSHDAFDGTIEHIEVEITNPNPPGSSSIIYHVGPPPGEPGSPTELTFYSESFSVAQADWSHGFGVWAYAQANSPAYQDSEEVVAYASEVQGLFGGHLDLDTSTFLSKIDHGHTRAHSHDITGKYDLTGIDFFDIPETKQIEIDEAIDPGTRFKIVAINGDLSPGLRVKMRYTDGDQTHQLWQRVNAYDDIPLEDLPLFSLDGAPGTFQLEAFALEFDQDVLTHAGVLPTNTGDVKKNVLGKNGEWRNGSFTFHIVRVNEDGTDAFTLDSSFSAGGVHGVATSGLLWEALVFWHWGGDSYHESGNQFRPGDFATIADHVEDCDCDHHD